MLVAAAFWRASSVALEALATGDLLEDECLGRDIHGEEFVRKEVLLEQIDRRVSGG